MEFIEWESSFLFLRKKDKKIRIDAVQTSLTGLEDIVGPYIMHPKDFRDRALVLMIKREFSMQIQAEAIGSPGALNPEDEEARHEGTSPSSLHARDALGPDITRAKEYGVRLVLSSPSRAGDLPI